MLAPVVMLIPVLLKSVGGWCHRSGHEFSGGDGVRHAGLAPVGMLISGVVSTVEWRVPTLDQLSRALPGPTFGVLIPVTKKTS